jgi:hypothetical protein
MKAGGDFSGFHALLTLCTVSVTTFLRPVELT